MNSFNKFNSPISRFNKSNNPNKKKGNKFNRFKNQQNQQNNCFFRDDIDGHKTFKSFDENWNKRNRFSIDDLVNRVKDKKELDLDFLSKLNVNQLKNDEESDLVKSVIKKLCDLLYDYQLANLTEDEKEIIKSRGLLIT